MISLVNPARCPGLEDFNNRVHFSHGKKKHGSTPSRCVVFYHIPIFSRAVLSEFNKVANVAWESGIWNDLVLDVEMDEISIFDKDGVLVAKIQC